MKDFIRRGKMKNNSVSIITPVYKGNKFIKKLVKNITKIARNDRNIEIEWILINDYPQQKLISLKSNLSNLSIKQYTNDSNRGIQASRIVGLNKATKAYVMFLDQDDELREDAITLHLKNIKNNDFSVANGYRELADNKLEIIYKNRNQMKYLSKLSTYFYLGNIILSPGMAVIKRKAISQVWKDNLLKINGADDWLLWVTLLAENKKCSLVYTPLYVHKKSEYNTSDDVENMILSSIEALNIFSNNYKHYAEIERIYRKRLFLWNNYAVKGNNKLIEYLKNPMLGWKLFKYKFLSSIE